MTDVRMGIFGGTFDPIHLGHLEPVLDAAQQLALSSVLLIPCHIPPHKAAPWVTPADRLQMARLAAGRYPLFEASDIELKRSRPSYTVDTLTQLKKQQPQQRLFFFMGEDSLLTFKQWYRWQDILKLANLVVCRRPDSRQVRSEQLPAILEQHVVTRAEELHRYSNGKIFLADTVQLPISSTDIRQRITSGQPWSHMLPPEVAEYIDRHSLYR